MVGGAQACEKLVYLCAALDQGGPQPHHCPLLWTLDRPLPLLDLSLPLLDLLLSFFDLTLPFPFVLDRPLPVLVPPLTFIDLSLPLL